MMRLKATSLLFGLLLSFLILALSICIIPVSSTEPSESQSANAMWIEFDFPDIYVKTDEDYYIVIRSESNITDCLYVNAEKLHNPYELGSSWHSSEDGQWTEYPKENLCFKTYGYNEDLEDFPPD